MGIGIGTTPIIRIRAMPRNGLPATILDQGIVSLSNFLTGVIVARAISPDEFGVFTLLMTGVLILSGFQSALIAGPLRVLGVEPMALDPPTYFRTQVWLQAGLSAVVLAFAAVILIAFTTASQGSILGFLLCVTLFQMQELARSINLTRFQSTRLLALDAATHGSRLAVLAVFAFVGWLSPGNALVVVGGSCAIGILLTLSGAPTAPPARGTFQKVTSENWIFGRWMFLESTAYMASTQIYFYLTALWLDTAAVGALAACQILANAANILVMGSMNYVTPTVRRKLQDDGHEAWRKFLWVSGIALTGLMFCYAVVLSWLSKPLITFLFSPSYAHYAHIVPILAIANCLRAPNTILLTAFRTSNLPRMGFVSKIASATVTIVIGYPLLTNWGVTGAAIGIVATQLSWTIVFFGYMIMGELSELPVAKRIR